MSRTIFHTPNIFRKNYKNLTLSIDFRISVSSTNTAKHKTYWIICVFRLFVRLFPSLTRFDGSVPYGFLHVYIYHFEVWISAKFSSCLTENTVRVH
jgi:hypothetical protein